MSTSLHSDQPAKGILLICCAVLLFASHDALSKYLTGFYPVILVVWARYVVHTALMIGLFVPQHGMRLLRTRRPGLQLLRALCLVGCSLLFTTGLHYLPMAEATAVNFLAPLLVTALSVPLLGERVSRGQWATVVAGLVGVLVMVRPGGGLFTPAILLPLGSATCFGLYQLLTRRLASIDSPTTSNFLAGVVNSLLMSIVLPWVWQWPSFGHALLMLVLGACGMGGHLLLTQAFRHAPPALLAPFSYLQIVFAGLIGLLVFADRPDGGAMLGMGVICVSGLAMAWSTRRR